MKVKLLLFVIMACSIIWPEFQVRELNYQNQQEVEQVSDLFKDEDIFKMTGGWTKEKISKLLFNYTSEDKDRYGNFFVCCNDSQGVCATLACTFDAKNKSAEIKILGVHKDYRGHGIASQLIQYTQDRCIEQSLLDIGVGVFPQNNAAIQ